jgi:mannosyltransferase
MRRVRMAMTMRKRMATMTSDLKLLTHAAAMIAKLQAMLSRQSLERHAGSLLIGIVGIQTLVSLPRIMWGSIWYDEFLTITTIQLPWRQIAAGGYPKELHPPLYFLVLKGWVAVFGQTEHVMRLLSLGLTLGSLLMLFLLVRQLIDLRAALATAFLFAVHPMYIYYATEIRMYALLIFCSLAAFLAAWRYCTIPQASPLGLVFLGIAVLSALYTHYFGLLIALGIGVLSLVRLALIRDRRAIAVLAVVVVCGMIYIPSVYFIIQRQIQEYRAIYHISADQQLTWQVFPGMLSGSASLFFTRTIFMNSMSLLIVLVGCAVLWRSGRSIVVLTLVWFILLSALFAFVVSANGVDVVPRYLLHVSVMSLILLGSTCMWQNPVRRWLNPRILGVVILSFYLYSGAVFSLRSEKIHPNWRAASTFIRSIDQPNEPIVILGWDATPVQFYLSDHVLLTSYDLESELKKQPQRSSYLLVQSEYGRAIPLAKPATELWQIPEDKISILRFVP